MKRPARFKKGQKIVYSPLMPSTFPDRPVWTIELVDELQQEYTLKRLDGALTKSKLLPFYRQGSYRVHGLKYEDQPR